jgi:phage protein D
MARYPFYAPEFRVKIDGEELPAALRGSISSLSYQDGLEGADRVELSIANERLRWLDHPLLQVDKGFKLSMGYAPDPLEEVFVGEITGVEPSFPSGGMPTLKIVAQDFLQRLTTGTKNRAFQLSIPSVGNFPLPDVVVASLVSGTNLLIPNPDPVGSALSILVTLASAIAATSAEESEKLVRRQTMQSDFNFLSGIARENGWEMYIDHTAEPRGYILRFQFLIQDYAPSVTLKWGESLMDFTPRLTTVGDVFGVAARTWIASIKTEFVLIASWDYDRAAFNLQIYPNLLGDIQDIIGAESARKTLSINPTSPVKAAQQVISELLPRLNNRLTGSGSAIGNLKLKAGTVINLEGLGEQFSGLYRITSATHSIDSGGYRTNFQARKEVWFGSIPIPKGDAGLARVQGVRS